MLWAFEIMLCANPAYSRYRSADKALAEADYGSVMVYMGQISSAAGDSLFEKPLLHSKLAGAIAHYCSDLSRVRYRS